MVDSSHIGAIPLRRSRKKAGTLGRYRKRRNGVGGGAVTLAEGWEVG